MNHTAKSDLPVAAVDLGGTKIAVGIISPEYRVIARGHHPTLANEGAEAVINRVISAVKQVSESQGISLTGLAGISIAAAGAIDSRKGLITISPNLPGWQNIPLGKIVSERLGVNTWLINDANSAALAEYQLGAGQGISNLIYISVGTGIGGAIIINGNLYTGACGSAGEIGHMTIENNGPKCGCGNIGCLEMLASGAAMAREALRRIANGEKSSLTNIAARNPAHITGKEIEAAARAGDVLAGDVIHDAAIYLGVGMVNMINIFNPEMIIVGGGVARMGELLLVPARQVVKERAIPLSAGAVRIVPSKLGNDAGLLGAACFAYRKTLMEVKDNESP